MTRPFSMLLSDLLGPAFADHPETFTALCQHPLDYPPSIELGELVRGLQSLRGGLQDPRLNEGDVVLGQALAPGGGREIAVSPRPEGAQQDTIQFFGGLRSHPEFLAALMALLAPVTSVTPTPPFEGARA